MTIAPSLDHLAELISRDLRDNLLAYWMNTVDEKNGGFYGLVSDQGRVDKNAPKVAVLCARILWTYAKAYAIYQDPRYLEMADRAFHYLTTTLWDAQHGGVYWSVRADGTPLYDSKEVYAQVFAMYGLAEYHYSCARSEGLDFALRLFQLIDAYAFDAEHGGYYDAFTRDWKPQKHSVIYPAHWARKEYPKKSMNTNLHVMEALTNLYRTVKDPQVGARLKSLIQVTMRHIVDPSTAHFVLFFGRDWTPLSDEVSYGHDIEGSWLLYEAALQIADPELLAKARDMSIRMADATFREGFDEDGAVFYEKGPKGLDTDKHWWPQAEAAVGLLNAYELTDDGRYLAGAKKTWTFILEHLVDKNHGEWFTKVSKEGVPPNQSDKVSLWKCPYHNSRAEFETLERLHHLATR